MAKTTTEIAQNEAPPSRYQRLPSRWLADDFSHFEPPEINYEPSRWATARTRNVDEIANAWAKDDKLAYVFNDPKLRGQELVMLKRKVLDRLVTPLLELHRGRAAIRVDFDMIIANVEALRHCLNSLISCLDPNVETTSEAARAALANVKMLEVQISKISASVVVSSPKDTEVASMTDEEEALAKELLAEEESDDD